jgi:hypothetical protein
MVICFMRTTLDIPDSQYRRLKVKAVHEGTSVRQIVLRSIDRELDNQVQTPTKRLAQPILKSRAPGSIRLNNEQIYDLIGFP